MKKQASDTLAEIYTLLARRKNEIENVINTDGPTRRHPEYNDILDKYNESRSLYTSIRTTLGRGTDALSIPSYWMFATFVLLALLEAPFNKFAFDNILKLGNLESYMASALVTFMVLGMAHAAGKLARQIRSESRNEIFYSNIILSVLLMLFIVFVLLVLTVARAHYAAQVEQDINIFDEVKKSIDAVGVFGTLSMALSNRAALALLTFNLLGVMFAFIMAYLTHDSDKYFENAIKQYEKAKKAKIDFESKFNEKISEVNRRVSQKIETQIALYSTYYTMLDDEERKDLPPPEEVNKKYTPLSDVLKEYKIHLMGEDIEKDDNAPEMSTLENADNITRKKRGEGQEK